MTDSQVILTKKPRQARKSNASVVLSTSYVAEDETHAKTHTYEVGVDEAGRGPLFGP
mgnify:FL=1